MKTIKHFILVLIAGVALNVSAQQDPMFSQYVFNGLIINPAYAGTHDVLSSTLLYRNQWVNVPGAPQTGVFSLDAPIPNRNVGVGLSVVLDKIGITNRNSITGAYSYRLKLNQGAISLGLQVGLSINTTNFTSVNYTEDTYNDQAFSSNYRDVFPTFGLGAYYYTDRFYAGISVPQISGQSLINAMKNSPETYQQDLKSHYLLTSGYVFDVHKDVKIKPSVLLKAVKGAPLELDINGTTWFYDLFALGISYRSLSSLNFFAEIKASNQLHFGYSYEYATTALSSYNSGSHEIMLQYLFDFSHSKIVTPRYF